jgi:hypothetical protein
MGISSVLSALGLLGTPTRSLSAPPPTVVPSPAQVRREPVPFHKLAAISGLGEQMNLSQTADIANINAAFRQSERGNPWNLYTFYRDFVLGSSHIQSVWGTRKQAVVGEPHTVIPASKDLQDVKAADAIKELIDNCENWHDGLLALLDATLYPNSVCEKIFKQPEGTEVIPLRYAFKRFEPVNPLLHWYGLPFMGSGQFVLGGGVAASQVSPVVLPNTGNNAAANDALVYNPNEWEPEIRLYSVLDNGFVDKSPSNAYKLEKIRHIVHRGGTLGTTVRDCYGGHMRSVLIWSFFSVMGRDGFMKLMDNYGQPLPVVKADLQQKDTLDFLTQAFQDCWKRHALFLDKITDADLRFEETDMTGYADAQELWINMCKSEITHLIIGQELSHTAKATGLGSGVAKLQGEVREDIRRWDIVKLGTTLKQQLFTPYLALNGIPGRAPTISWGGVVPEDALTIAQQLSSLKSAGLEPDDESLESISEKFGYTLQRVVMPVSEDIPGKQDDKPEALTAPATAGVKPLCALCDCEDCDTPDEGCDHWCHGNVYAVANAQARKTLKALALTKIDPPVLTRSDPHG